MRADSTGIIEPQRVNSHNGRTALDRRVNSHSGRTPTGHYKDSARQQPHRADSAGRRQTPVQPRSHLGGPGGEVRKGTHPEAGGQLLRTLARAGRAHTPERGGNSSGQNPSRINDTRMYRCSRCRGALHATCLIILRSMSCIVSPSQCFQRPLLVQDPPACHM